MIYTYGIFLAEIIYQIFRETCRDTIETIISYKVYVYDNIDVPLFQLTLMLIPFSHFQTRRCWLFLATYRTLQVVNNIIARA